MFCEIIIITKYTQKIFNEPHPDIFPEFNCGRNFKNWRRIKYTVMKIQDTSTLEEYELETATIKREKINKLLQYIKLITLSKWKTVRANF